jgi:hypothetical protein
MGGYEVAWENPASYLHKVPVDEWSDKVPTRACNPEEEACNQRGIAYMDRMEALNADVVSAIQSLESGGRNVQALDRAIDTYQSNWQQFQYFLCTPSGFYLRNKINRSHAAVSAAANRATAVLDRVYRDFSNTVDSLSPPIADLERLRLTFENQINLPQDLEQQFVQVHQQFLNAKSEAQSYRMVATQIGSRTWDPSQQLQSITTLVAYESRLITFTELDRLRLEYVARAIPCPPPHEFSQGKSCTYAPNAELMQDSDYSWGILPDELLAKIDAIGAAFEAEGWVNAQGRRVTSVYRSPARNPGAARSRHLYGRAADFRVYDIDANGQITEAGDWQLMMDKAILVGAPAWHEPFNAAQPHVHVQWEGWGTVAAAPYEAELLAGTEEETRGC